jgi:hypothetical protein
MSLLAVLTIMLLIMVFGCATAKSVKKDNSDYRKASKENTVTAYEEYIEKYPEGEHSEEAKQNLIKMEWEKTKKANTIEGYRIFIKKYKEYPNSSSYMKLADQNIRTLSGQSDSKKTKKQRKWKLKDKGGRNKQGKSPQTIKKGNFKLISFAKRQTSKSEGRGFKNYRVATRTFFKNFFSRTWQLIRSLFNKTVLFFKDAALTQAEQGRLI